MKIAIIRPFENFPLLCMLFWLYLNYYTHFFVHVVKGI